MARLVRIGRQLAYLWAVIRLLTYIAETGAEIAMVRITSPRGIDRRLAVLDALTLVRRPTPRT